MVSELIPCDSLMAMPVMNIRPVNVRVSHRFVYMGMVVSATMFISFVLMRMVLIMLMGM